MLGKMEALAEGERLLVGGEVRTVVAGEAGVLMAGVGGREVLSAG